MTGVANDAQATGLADMPTGAAAAVLNVADVDPTVPSTLTIYPSNTPPSTPDLTLPVGGVASNLVIATLWGSGGFYMMDQGTEFGFTDIIIDVDGWYTSDDTAQSNLNGDLTLAQTQATQNGQSFPASDSVIYYLTTDGPQNQTFTTAPSTTQNQISVATSADGNSIILAARANTSGNCWYIVDNLADETASPPWSAPGAVFVGAGTWYGEVKDTGTPPTCEASTAPGGPNSATQAFANSGSFPDL